MKIKILSLLVLSSFFMSAHSMDNGFLPDKSQLEFQNIFRTQPIYCGAPIDPNNGDDPNKPFKKIYMAIKDFKFTQLLNSKIKAGEDLDTHLETPTYIKDLTNEDDKDN